LIVQANQFHDTRDNWQKSDTIVQGQAECVFFELRSRLTLPEYGDKDSPDLPERS